MNQKLEMTLTKDDYLHFHKYDKKIYNEIISKIEGAKIKVLMTCIGLPLALTILSELSTNGQYLFKILQFIWTPFLIVFVILYMLLSYNIEMRIDREINKIIDDSIKKNPPKSKIILFSDQEIIVQDIDLELHIKKQNIDRIDNDGSMLFIYSSVTPPIFIPKRLFHSQAEFEDMFMILLNTYRSKMHPEATSTVNT
jgi:hypothetical protein